MRLHPLHTTWVAVAILLVSPVRFFDLTQPPGVVFLLGLTLQALVLVPLALAGLVDVHPSRDRLSGELMGPKLSAAFVSPLWEEIIFRAPLIWVWAQYPQYIIPATAVSSFVFAFGHKHQFPIKGMPLFALWRTLVGWLYAWVAIVSGGIVLSTVLHTLNNGAASLLMWRRERALAGKRKEFLWGET